MTTTLFNVIRSELMKKGMNEFVDKNGNLIFFEEEHQFMTKILKYDADVSSIVNHLFSGIELPDSVSDKHFKKTFITRFLNRRIGRQTIEAFRLQLLSTYLTNEHYITRLYKDLDLYLQQTRNSEGTNQNISEEKNKSSTAGTNSSESTTVGTTDNRDAESTLPQNNVQLDVNNTVMTAANSNRIARNKQISNDQSSGKNDSLSNGETFGTSNGENQSKDTEYRLDELLKTRTLYETIYDEFDRKCFMQTW